MTSQAKVKKAIRGNDKAFYELIQEQQKKLYYTAFLYVKNEESALDIVQETIFKAYKSIKNLKEPSYFSTWLYKILINTALNFIKWSNRVVPMDDIEKYTERIYLEQVPIENKIDLMDALDCLPGHYKTVIILRYYKDFTVKQISEVLDIPEGTIKTYLHRAIRQLKKELYIKENY
ncbi:MAG TPA: sigma-70 family RNA polymerase sigma factor [Bacillaceae bacterium]|nr:sigma-70 family RNA polymerase sigma factor [Paenibacillus bovis]HLU22417.1 sigma-70 family RNA polymerase sigma factor [Bacillaceae bacterium]